MLIRYLMTLVLEQWMENVVQLQKENKTALTSDSVADLVYLISFVRHNWVLLWYLKMDFINLEFRAEILALQH